MGSLVKKQTEKFLRDKKRRKRWMAMFLCLALLVTSGTFAALRMDGRAMDDDGNAESGTEVYDESLYAGEPVQDSAQGEQGETGGSLDGEDAGQPEMGDADAGNADIGTSPDGEDVGQPEINDPDAGNMDMGPQEPEDPGTGAVDPNENIEGGQPDEGNSPEEDTQQPDGQIRETVIKTAESQIGNTYDQYAALDEEGVCQEDWSALFVSYCLSQAGIEGIPLETDSRQWMEKLKAEEGGLYRDDTYSPKPGDIVFYRPNAESPYGLLTAEEGEETADVNTTDTDSIRAGFVKEWNAEAGEIQVIAGDVETDGTEQDRVNKAAYSVSGEDAQITIEGYGQLPEADTQEPGTEGENAGAEIGSGAEDGTDMPKEPETNGDVAPDSGENEDPQKEETGSPENNPDGLQTSGNTASENITSGNTVSGNTTSGNAVSGNAISWGTLQSKYDDVKISDDNEEKVRTWDVSSTSHRYLEIPVRINISAAVGTKIELPCTLDNVGRTVEAGGKEYTHKPALQSEGIREEDWELKIDETGNTATIISKGQHASLDVFYRFDCWNIISERGFTIPCKVTPNGGGETSYELKGKIRTGHDVGFVDYINGVGNSDYGFDGFGGVDKQTAFIPKWNQVYETYFGVTEAQFNNNDYVYDIAAFAVRPEHQQPYDISGCFDPKEGELVGGVYMMDSRKRPDELCIKLNLSKRTKSTGGTVYDFEINNEQLKLNEGRRYAVVSDLSDENDNKVYTLYFLVKYQKKPKVQKIENGEPVFENGKPVMVDPDITLKAELKLDHKGVDNKVVKTATEETILYDGTQEPTDRIYWAAYLQENTENRTGLSSLMDNKDATVDFTADFFCLNEDRANFNKDDPEKYRLEAVIDLSFLPDVNGKPMLGEKDYQFSSYSLSLIDAEGAWSHNKDGVPNVGWKPEKYGVAPEWAKTEMIKIYGSKSLTDQTEGTWKLIKEVPASDVWVEDVDRSIKNGNENIEIPKEGYVRLKVVYNSRLTTALRVGYQMELKPTDFWKTHAGNLEELRVRSWFNYLGYKGDTDVVDEASTRFQRYPVNDNDKETAYHPENGTIELARRHDNDHPYPGYIVPTEVWDFGYSLRNRATVTLKQGGDVAGMLVTQALYDSGGGVVGTGDKPGSQSQQDSYSRQKEVSNASEVVYSIAGVVTDGSNNASALNAYREKITGQSPYKAMKQRYYVLLPEGLTLNMDPDNGEVTEKGEPKYHSWGEGTDRYLSPWANFYNGNSTKVLNSNDMVVPVSDGKIKNWRPNSWANVSEMYWWNAGKVEQNSEKSKGQLFIFDRILTDSAYSEFNKWESPTTFGWGQGFSFSVVPKRGTGALNEGNYTVQFWCQFLDDNGDPLPMNDFIRENNGEAEDLRNAYGGNIDDSTLLYIPSTFTNHSAAGSSKTEIGLSGDDVEKNEETGRDEVKLEGKYKYELKYSVNNGQSTDVVLWCNIEGYDHNGERSEWKGILTGVDLNGNSGVEVYVQADQKEININEYLRDGCGVEWLTAEKGWTKVDPNSYGNWGDVKSIAFSFKGRTFNSQNENDKEASVLLNMEAPQKEDVVTRPFKDVYTAYNEFIFSDKQGNALGQTQPGRGLSDYTQLDMHVPVEMYELPSTGGAGIYWYTIGGMLLMLAATLILYKNKRKGVLGG